MSKKIFCKEKNIGRVNPERGGVDDPPQKIVGLKFCGVVLTCPKKFFVKKKNIGRINPWGGGVDDPPPRK